MLARDYLDATWGWVVSEHQALQGGNPVADPLCMAPIQSLSGHPNHHTSELAGIRLALFQSETQTFTRDGTFGARASSAT